MKTKAFSLIVLLLTAAATALRTVCLLTQYESQIGYFQESAFTIVYRALLFAGVFACLLSGVLLSKARQANQTPTACQCGKAWAPLYTLAAACCFFSGIYFLTSRASNSIVLYIATGIFSIGLAMFFLINCSSDKTKSAATSITLSPWLCLAGIPALLLMLVSSYFDMTVTLNGPFAAPSIFAALFGCLFLLAEARMRAMNVSPRFHLAFTHTTFFLCTSVGVSNLIFSLFGDPANGISLSEPARPLLLLAITFATSARLFFPSAPPSARSNAEKF